MSDTPETEVEEPVVAEAPAEGVEAPEPEAAAAEDAPPAEAAAEPVTDEGAPESKGDAWWNRRIKQLTGQREEEKRRAEAAEAALQRYLTGEEASEAAGGEQDVEARIQEGVRRETERQQRAAEQRQFAQRCNEVYQKGATAFPDFDSALTNLGHAGVIDEANPIFIRAALTTDAPERVLHHLGANPDEAMRIASLEPLAMAAEMARLAVKLNTPVKPPVSAVPPPERPIAGTASAVFNPDTASMEEFIRWREGQRAH